jgi:hypothetical protein
MLILPKNKVFLVFLLLLLFFISCFRFSIPVLADWREDAEVTEVGRNAERARELLYWLFFHPSLDYQSAGIREIWVIARNIVYLLFIIVLVIAGIFLMFFKGRGFNITPWIPKLIALIVFATFYYVFVLGLVALGDMVMQFFIKIAGCNLFNIHFSGPGSSCEFSPDALRGMEKNYTEFIGYRYYDENASMVSNESAHTSLWIIKFTTFTYNVMSIALVLRKVILWFLIIVSPFLAILAPFVFIRNVGWIWIGVFFQWLFYGPMMALFLSGLVKIWETGIPYGFDWARRDLIQAGPGAGGEDWVFPTVINILVGGPAQSLTTRNSLNFVDTYAEYMIALVMLWAVIFLPWLLLRIFRDYCCHSVRAAVQAQAPAVWGLYDELRKWGGPSAPPEAPTAAAPAAAVKLELPYRRPVATPRAVTAQEAARISREVTEQIARQGTQEIVRALGLAIPSIRDVALADMNIQKRKLMERSLEALKSPAALTSEVERRKFTAMRQELRTRALKGDIAAQKVLTAAGGEKEKIVTPIVVSPRPKPSVAVPPKKPIPGIFVPKAKVPSKAKVSVEDYEEVKKMWANNYRLAEVPISDKIKTREGWLKYDITKITNTIDLLASALPEMKKKGLINVEEILPFLLLGGFTEEETITYLKAKLAAAKLVLEELERIARAKEEVKEEKEELVEVPIEKKKEEEEALEAVRRLAQEMPKEEPSKVKPPKPPKTSKPPITKPRTFKKGKKSSSSDIDTSRKG